ncbi:leucine-rich repeat transmembrane protein FLRT2 [Trichomycterus rosablanca]|uniref:leucine-rich repeat transmembrane protein FLRT2 n=1 Tax=Trichomycterus rosablanca TaxID=2290929 RepID=UPI002F3599A4
MAFCPRMEFQMGVLHNDWTTFLRFWFTVFLGLYVQFDPVASCPKVCRCDKTFIYCNERSLTSVPLGVQEGYKTLFLQNNQINNAGFPSELHGVASLEFVSLYGNQLDEFPLNLPKNVRTLHLQENNIQTISRGALGQLQMLEELHLDDNSISTVGVEDGAFQEAASLKLLFLTKNHLSSIPAGLPTDLKELRLDENRIAVIHQDAFRNVTNLQRVILDGNLLEDDAIAEGAFQNLVNLKELSLTRNSLTTPPSLLPGSLVRLYLQENQMKDISVSAFSGLGQLEKLDLSGNVLQTLPQGVFNGLKSLTHLNVRNNQWRCDCAVKWIVTWLKSLPSSTNVKGFICHRPDRLKGMVIRELPVDTLECPGSTTVYPRVTQLPPTTPLPHRTTDLPWTSRLTTGPSTVSFPTTTRPTPPPPQFVPNFPPPYEDPMKMSVLFVNATFAEVSWESYFTVTAYKVTWVKRSQSLMMDVSRERTVPGDQRRLGLYDLEPKSDYRICVYILDTLNSYRPGEDTICTEIRTKAAPRSPGNTGNTESEQVAQQDPTLTFLLAGVIGGVALIVLITLLGLFCWHVHRKSRASRAQSEWKYSRGRRKDDYCEAGTKKDNSILEITETSFQIVPLNNEQLLKGDFRIQPVYTPNVGIGYRDCHRSNNSLVFCKSSNVPTVDFCHT